MTQLTITLDLKHPPFRLSFTWDGTPEEAASTAQAVAQAAQRGGITVESYRLSSVVHAATLFRDPDENVREAVMMAILDLVLHASTEVPEHPGRIGDYLALYDFDVVISQTSDRTIQVKADAHPAGDIHGEA